MSAHRRRARGPGPIAVAAIFSALSLVSLFSQTARADDDGGGADPPKKFKPRFMAGIDAGFAYRELYGSHFIGGEITGIAGVDLKPGAISLTSDLLYGKTEYGLTTWDWHMSTVWDFRFNRVRLGLGPSITYLQIGRVTTPEHPFWVVGAGLVGQVSYDLVQYDVVREDGRPTSPHAFYAAIRFNFDDYLEQDDSSAITYGPTFALGYRY